MTMVDPGETRTFGPQERCITPRSKCNVHGVSQTLRFEVPFFEEDSCPGRYCHGITPGADQQLRSGKCEPDDDLIGARID